MRDKVRPKYVQKLINEVNLHLRKHWVTRTDDTLFQFAVQMLVDNHMYQGYNFYNNVDNPTLAGSATYYEFLQIY